MVRAEITFFFVASLSRSTSMLRVAAIRTLHASSRFLNLYNRKDESLILYPGLFRSDHHRAGLSRPSQPLLG